MTGDPIPSAGSLAALKAERDRLRTKLVSVDSQIAILEARDYLEHVQARQVFVEGLNKRLGLTQELLDIRRIPTDQLFERCMSINPRVARITNDCVLDATMSGTGAHTVTVNAY